MGCRTRATSTLGAAVLVVASVILTLDARADGGEHDVSGLSGSPSADTASGGDRPTITRWAPSSGSDCHSFHGRRMCDGPRRVPELAGEARERAEALGMIGPRVAQLATTNRIPEAWLEEVRAAFAVPSTDLAWPVPEGRIWRGFGLRRSIRVRSGRRTHTRQRRMHEGMDIGARQGSLILAVDDGMVLYSDNGMHGYGNAVIVLHPNGDVSLYAHCLETYVVPGQLVRRADPLAAVGQTGLAHGAHLHLEYRRNGQRIDPRPHFAEIPNERDAAAASPEGASPAPASEPAAARGGPAPR